MIDVTSIQLTIRFQILDYRRLAYWLKEKKLHYVGRAPIINAIRGCLVPQFEHPNIPADATTILTRVVNYGI